MIIHYFSFSFRQLKDQIVKLEKRLITESKRTEDLQASIEEATFCGDELNVRIRFAYLLS